jgi:hypothetical protein
MRKDEEHLKWCFKQRNGIKLSKPSNNLEKAYREKARNAIKSMDVNAREGITEWAVSASYYAKYFKSTHYYRKSDSNARYTTAPLHYSSIYSTTPFHHI